MAINIPLRKSNSSFKSGTYNDLSSSFPRSIGDLRTSVDSKTQFHVNYLKNQFKDLARPNMFKVEIKPPTPLLVEDWTSEKQSLITLAKSASFPQISIKEWIYERAGQKLHIPTNEMDYGDVSITFYNDSNFDLRTLFNKWQRLAIYNWEYNIGCLPLLALDGEVSIFQYDVKLNPIYAIRLTNCWPQTISSIELSQDIENTAEEFTVDFKFTMHEVYKNGTI